MTHLRKATSAKWRANFASSFSRCATKPFTSARARSASAPPRVSWAAVMELVARESEPVEEAEPQSQPAEAQPVPPKETEEEAASGRKRPSQGGSGSPNSSVRRNGSLRRDGSHRRGGSLRRDQRTGEKRRSRTGSLGSLVGYEAKFPVSGRT